MEDNGPQVIRSTQPQVLLFCGGFLCGIVYGMSMGHSAVLLPMLQKSNSTLVVDEETGSWIASVYAIAAPSGCIFCGIAMDFWGRKKLGIIGNGGVAMGWLLIFTAQNPTMILVGRILEGVCRSILATSITVLIDELAAPKYRGFIACGVSTGASLGILVISLFGTFLHWRTASGVSACLPILNLILFFFISESPIWFVKNNRKSEAAGALKWLWGSNNNIQANEELVEMMSQIRPEEQKTHFSADCNQAFEVVKRFMQPGILKPFLILHTYNALMTFCGLGLFTYYSVDFMSKIRQSEENTMDDYSTTILLSAVRLIMTFLSSISMLFLGRRTISIISGTCSSISATLLSALLYVRTKGDLILLSNSIVNISFALTVIYAGSMSFGFFNVPPIMIGETQPNAIRGFACGYIYTINDLLLGGIVKLYPWLLSTLNIEGIFLMFGISCIVSTVFVYLFLPETHGRTLQETEDYFKGDNIMWITRHKYTNRVTENVTLHPSRSNLLNK